MSASIKHYFVCANSSRGFYNFFESNLDGLKTIYILKGGPGTGKSTLMKKIGTHFNELGYDIELIHCSSDPNSLDGVIIPTLSVAVVDGTAPHVIEPKAPGAIEEYVNLGQSWDSKLLKPHTDEILKLQAMIKDCYQQLYSSYGNALKIHDEWEKIYINEMNFNKSHLLRQYICDTLLNFDKQEHQPSVKHRFFGASTPTGSIDFIENLTQDLDKRYFIKGRAGTGKSTLLKQLGAHCQELGYDVELYHCALDPESLDMIIIPAKRICFFDSTQPHEYFPSKPSDEIIDMYQQLVTKGTDELYASELEEIQGRYHQMIKEGRLALKEAKQLHDQLEQFYTQAVDFNIVQQIYEDIKSKIESLM